VSKSGMIVVWNLFNDAITKPDYTESDDKTRANGELGRMWKEAVHV
jgi:hypothetical protein